MKKISTLIFSFCLSLVYAQQTYYDDVNLSLSGQDLYYALQQKIEYAGAGFTYGEIRDVMKITDEDPNNANNVLLIYGYNDNDNNCTTDRTRNKNDFGGSYCEYNREHVFARSNSNPPMGRANNSASGIVADPHNLRPADQRMNSDRGNRKMGSGSGYARVTSSNNFYPGDEWKGDVARMMMYMYVRYGAQCLPSLNGTGELQDDTEMLKIYLQWNAEDPVSAFEDERNPLLEQIYGNRNPFIDNPYLATLIWGGPAAEDRWGMINTETFLPEYVSVFPNPANDVIWISNSTAFDVDHYVITDTSGRIIVDKPFDTAQGQIDTSRLSKGVYLLQLSANNKKVVKKIMIQ